MVNEAQNRGFFIKDLAGSACVKTNIFQDIIDYDPLFFFGIGHGNDCIYTDDREREVWSCCTTQNLVGRIVYLWSCLTANGLGPDIINEKGGLAYAGFNISWTWMAVDGPTGDPYDDKYAHGFYEAGNELILALLQFKTLDISGDQSIAKYNEWIDYWKTTGVTDPYAADAIRWLVHDRNGLVLLGYLNATLTPAIDCAQFLTKDECLAHLGCKWWNNSCHNLPPTCEEINNEIDCLEYKCHWYNGECHSKLVCEDINNQTDCEANNCYWYNGSCHAFPPVDHTQDFNISIVGGAGRVGDIGIPDIVSSGIPFTIKPYVCNIGGADKIWIKTINKTTGETWFDIDKNLEPGECIMVISGATIKQPGEYICACQCGHYENGERIMDDEVEKTVVCLEVHGFPTPGKRGRGLGMDSQGNMWHVDSKYLNETVYKLDHNQDGNIIKSFTLKDAGIHNIDPRGLMVDKEGYIWVSTNRYYDVKPHPLLEKYDQDGNYISSLEFDRYGLGMDSQGYLWASSSRKVYKYSMPDGTVVGGFDVDISRCVLGDLTIDQDDYIWVTDMNNNKIYKFNQSGELIKSIAHLGDMPIGLTIENNNLWIADPNVNWIYRVEV